MSGNLKNVSWANQSQSYQYDPYDRRVATLVNGVVKSKLVYGLGSVPVAELNENDRIVNTFVYADGFTPILMRKGSVDYYVISDIRGSVRMVVKSSTGELRQKIQYDSFGNILEDTNPGYTPFAFAGGLYDYRTGLTRFGARDYSPEIGRWTAEDPIGFWSGDINFIRMLVTTRSVMLTRAGYRDEMLQHFLSFLKLSFQKSEQELDQLISGRQTGHLSKNLKIVLSLHLWRRS